MANVYNPTNFKNVQSGPYLETATVGATSVTSGLTGTTIDGAGYVLYGNYGGGDVITSVVDTNGNGLQSDVFGIGVYGGVQSLSSNKLYKAGSTEQPYSTPDLQLGNRMVFKEGAADGATFFLVATGASGTTGPYIVTVLRNAYNHS